MEDSKRVRGVEGKGRGGRQGDPRLGSDVALGGFPGDGGVDVADRGDGGGAGAGTGKGGVDEGFEGGGEFGHGLLWWVGVRLSTCLCF